MATVPARHPATLVGQILGLLAALNRPRDGKKAAAWAAKTTLAAREHVTTVAAFAAIDFGCFRASTVAGWIMLGVSLLIIEWKIRGLWTTASTAPGRTTRATTTRSSPATKRTAPFTRSRRT